MTTLNDSPHTGAASTNGAGLGELHVKECPWGSWHEIDQGPGYKVKRLHVKPGCRLSYQLHACRREHWFVLRGEAACTVNDTTTQAGPGVSVDVPLGARHRLANTGAAELVVIEIQQGDYTGEDDIVRIEDDYGRVPSR